jgi:hypothetical protein
MRCLADSASPSCGGTEAGGGRQCVVRVRETGAGRREGGLCRGKSPAAKAKKTAIKKVAPKKKTTKARGHKVTHLHAANIATHLDQPR